MNRNVPAGTAGTIATDVAPSGKLVVKATSPGETVYTRTDTPIARDKQYRFAAKLVKAYQPETGARDPNDQDVSILCETTEVWDTSTPNPNGYVFPAKVHTVIRVPYHADLAIVDAEGLFKSHLQYVIDHLADLLRLKTDVA